MFEGFEEFETGLLLLLLVVVALYLEFVDWLGLELLVDLDRQDEVYCLDL